MTPTERATRDLLRMAQRKLVFSDWVKTRQLRPWEKVAKRFGLLAWLERKGFVEPEVEPMPAGGEHTIRFRRPLVLTLPASPAVGDVIRVSRDDGTIQVCRGGGQKIVDSGELP